MAEPFFYIYGGAGLIWSFVWMRFVKNSPEIDLRITFDEKTYIRNSLAG